MKMFITIEGPNGVGKSSFIEALANSIKDEFTVYCTKEPTETDFGRSIRVNESKLRGIEYAKMIAKDRKDHLSNEIVPMLKKYDVVISDRYIESSMVFQVFDGVSADEVWNLNQNFLIPDISIIILASEDVIQKRLLERKVMTYFEKCITRKEEIDFYKKAGVFLTNKGYNIVELTNDTIDDLQNNISKISGMMRKALTHN